ncbi:shikimate dehydrogenase [Demequina zhanjiangensis]|uniref:Shikimate dehydrogenase n=1 Tax=Demequina zhanjiangensis TaxID=3051659 RepID=A0ABT8G0W9_9MICO|nr:shikimate dehydrogenase [Demequina sp. SYSU T00b26]MDN4472786.1 shikimate dehydrogenase [Demequina sp. SYSU T00b26]
MTGAERRAGVLGHPIAHSLSPALHRAAYRELGLSWKYDAYDVTEPELPSFIEGLGPEWAGLSLTMPLKAAAMPLMDFIEPMAKLVGALNTVVVQHVGDTRQLVGANTDVHGIVAAFREAGLEHARTAVVIGGGATATSAVAALGQLGCVAPVVAVRNRARAGGLVRAASRMGLSPVLIPLGDVEAGAAAVARAEQADAVVSTIPAAAGSELASSVQGPSGVLLDVVYDPLVTPFAEAWRGHGGATIGGQRMLLHQAVEQVRLMTGQIPSIQTLESALP